MPSTSSFCIYGHGYQPPREDPYSGCIPLEPGAEPFENFNQKISAECYAPNAKAGNFQRISFDMGPTLLAWLEHDQPEVYREIIEADRLHRERYGVSNVLGQAYNHTILPLATTRDKRTQILWGLQDYQHRYGHSAHGMWLAETAVDEETLDILAQQGVIYTVLDPRQAASSIDITQPYHIPLRNGRSITAFFYNPLSGGVSYLDDWTMNADTFAQGFAQQYAQREGEREEIHIIATDLEFYGHHKRDRDQFLSRLLGYSAQAAQMQVRTLEDFLQRFPATKEVRIHEASSWSCAHGVERWSLGCSCTEGDGRWKAALRLALVTLATQSASLFEQDTQDTLHDPWAARDSYLALHQGRETLEQFWMKQSRFSFQTDWREQAEHTRILLEAQYYLQYAFTSCGWFFEDIDRIEPKNNIAFAHKALNLMRQALGQRVDEVEMQFLHDLRFARSWRTRRTGADLYNEVEQRRMRNLIVPNSSLIPLPV